MEEEVLDESLQVVILELHFKTAISTFPLNLFEQ